MKYEIKGQIKGGKNNIVITRTGRRFPKASWAKWRDEAVKQILAQKPLTFDIITSKVKATVLYVRGDERRRDMPATIDAIWHTLERAGIVKDDCLITELIWIDGGLSRTDPKAIIQLDAIAI